MGKFSKGGNKMFEMSIDKHDLERIEEFLDESNLVQIMNDFGLEIQQMALILQSISDGIKKAKTVLEGEIDE